VVILKLNYYDLNCSKYPQVKNILLFSAALIYANSCFSQNVIDRKKSLTAFVTEKYHTVIETTKEVKQGQYQAFYNKNLLVNGQFTNDKKTGIWRFNNKYGQLLETYNYDTNTLVYEASEDTLSNMRYNADIAVDAKDRTTKPIKIGGRYYAYLPYLKLFKLPAYIQPNMRDNYVVILELLVSPGGRLADCKIHLKLGTDDDIVHVNTDLLKEEDKQFIPATLNGQPISCRIFIRCYINYYDEIDI
jgi:hypothetical protein